MNRRINRIAEMIVASGKIVALTGAGVSTESGIPDFRGPQGLWSLIDPKLSSIEFFMDHPEEFWYFMLGVIELVRSAQPNMAHYALAELERMGKLSAIITQNIDGLHFKAGSRNVIELHGDLRTVRCTKCRRVMFIDEALSIIKTGIFPPKCRECDSLLKFNVVLFNEPIPQSALFKAYAESESCDLMISVGTSLQVYPAAHLPLLAKRQGAKLAIINLEPTPLDDMADVVVRAKAGEVLMAIVERVRKLESKSSWLI